MAFRRIIASLLLVTAAAVPARAADDGVGLATSVMGSISTQTPVDTTSDSPTYEVVGNCTYTGQSGGGRMVIRFGGGAAGYGEGLTQATEVTCSIHSDLGDSMERNFILPGPAGVAVDQTPSWPIAPLTVCVWGRAYFGPTPVVVKEMPIACRRTIL